MNSNNEAIVTVEDVVKHFKSGGTLVRAVDGVSVNLPGGN